jgi:hypothetical protein
MIQPNQTVQIAGVQSSQRLNENVEESQTTESLVTNLVSLSSGEERERKMFMTDLNKFMTEIGKPLSKIPIMGYKELDLFQLFKEVSAYGGFNEVVKNVGTWSKIWKRLGNFDPSITDSSFRLKKNYERYLLEYEYKIFPEHRQQALEFERQLQLKKSSQQLVQASAPTSNSEPTSPTIAMAHLSLNGLPNPFAVSGSSRSSLKTSSEKISKSKKSVSKVSSPPASPTISSRPALTRSYSAGSLFKGVNAAMYREIPREKDGSPKLPLVLGELTIESLGTVIPRFPYITERHTWPVGFVSFRYFSSMTNPEVKVRYTSQIVDSAEGKPQFIVTAEDDADHPIVAHSPSAAWRTVLKRVISNSGNTSTNISVSGTMRFGLAHPIVSHLIRELPGAQTAVIESSGVTNTAGAGSDNVSSSSSWTSPSRPKRKAFQRSLLLTSSSNSNSSDDSSSAEDSFDLSTGSSSDSSPYNHMDYLEDGLTSPKIHKTSQDLFSARTVTFSTREEMDDLESAVATLQALKYCAVY